MAKDTDHLAGGFESENTGGLLTGLLAEEDEFDRRTLWRLGSWGAASVGAVIVAMLANQSAIGWRRDQVAAADLTRQAQQIQSVARESQSETRRLASAIDTLNGDRDRLYSRVTVLEQGLDTVTGAIARQNTTTIAPQSAVAEPPPATVNMDRAPVVSPVATTVATTTDKSRAGTALAGPAPPAVSSAPQASSNPAATPATPLMETKSVMAPPDPAARKLVEPEASAKPVAATSTPEVVASVATEPETDGPEAAAPKVAVQRTEFGVDVGGANSIAGLRALWRGLLKSNEALAALRPIIAVKEGSTGLGMQLRLVAGPLTDAAAAAKICAALVASERPCETTLFDGQRLVMKAAEPPIPAKPAAQRRSPAKRAVIEEPKKPEASMLSSFLGKR